MTPSIESVSLVSLGPGSQKHFKSAMASRQAAFSGNTSLIATFSSLYHATACNATHGIAVAIILSVRPSVRLSDACIVTKLHDALWIFLYRTKGQSL